MMSATKRAGTVIAVALAAVYLTFLVDVYTLNTWLKRLFVLCYFLVMGGVADLLLRRLRKRVPFSRRRTVISAVLASALLAAFSGVWFPKAQNISVTLSSVECAETASLQEVWLTEVILDGESVVLSQLDLDATGWSYSPEYDDYVSRSLSGPDNSLTFQVTAREMTLRFGKNPWSGSVCVIGPEETPRVLTLYSAANDPNDPFVEYKQSFDRIYAPWEYLLYGAGFLVIFTTLISLLLCPISLRTGREQIPKPPLSPHTHMAPKAERDANLDLIRAVASFLVVSVHFFLNNGYYSEPMQGTAMLVMTIMRMAFMCCVPLFMMLTGYLGCHRELTGRYYLGIIRVLGTYLLCSLVCIGTQIVGMKAPMDLASALSGIARFTAAPYAWYVKMYMGLFLLIPLFAAAWKGLETRKRRLAGVITLVVLTSLPTVNLGGFPLFVDNWLSLYPLAFCAIGAYYREYSPKPRWYWIALAFIAVIFGKGSLIYMSCKGQAAGFSQYFESTVVAASALLFLLLRQIPADRFPGWLKWIIRKCATLSLGIYLVSWCFDSVFYPMLARSVPAVSDRLPWYFVVVPAVYFCSALAAQVIEWCRKGVALVLNRCFPGLELH